GPMEEEVAPPVPDSAGWHRRTVTPLWASSMPSIEWQLWVTSCRGAYLRVRAAFRLQADHLWTGLPVAHDPEQTQLDRLQRGAYIDFALPPLGAVIRFRPLMSIYSSALHPILESRSSEARESGHLWRELSSPSIAARSPYRDARPPRSSARGNIRR